MMMRRRFTAVLAAILFAATGLAAQAPAAHNNFRVAVYIPISAVEQMKDPAWLQSTWDQISSQVKVDKVYIETYRGQHFADDQLLESVKTFFTDRHVQVAGGIAYTVGETQQFRSFSYRDPKDRETVKKVAALTARHFDEIMLDDFFFNNTKTDADIEAKGTRTWTQFRLDLMDQAARELVLAPARAANPRVKVIIKFPNWYEHFQGNGYDLDREPKEFDAIYTGTETRDPVMTDQQLQPYESYEIFRYFENIKPGGNGGGWVDTFAIRYVDRYAEQLWDTIFAKAPEITLFAWPLLLQPATPGERGAWSNLNTSFDYKKMIGRQQEHRPATEANMASVAGYALEQADAVAGKLGKPLGIASYKPYQSHGEDFLHNYLGMLGVPVEMTPDFPSDAPVVLLTESAKFDNAIVDKIKAHLRAGKNVVITSGLLHALSGKGIEDIVEMEVGNPVAVDEYWASFGAGGGEQLSHLSAARVVVPRIAFITNDAWPVVRGTANGYGAPLLLMHRYSKGILFVLTVPASLNDLYSYPQPVWAAIKSYLLADFPVQLDAPAKVALFAYDNHAFLVESFLDQEAPVTLAAVGYSKLRNVLTGEVVPASGKTTRGPLDGVQRNVFHLTIQPHTFLAFTEEP